MYEMALEYIQQARQNRGRLQQQQEAYAASCTFSAPDLLPKKRHC